MALACLSAAHRPLAASRSAAQAREARPRSRVTRARRLAASTVETSTETPAHEAVTSAGTEDAERSLLDRWWPLTFSKSVSPDGAPTSAALFGEPLVVYRGPSGEAVVAQDRCLHKSCPLTLGKAGDAKTDGEANVGRLVCRYHGWAFGDEGKIDDVPTQPDKAKLPKSTLCTYPSMETDDLVWCYPGDPAQLASAPVPEDTSCRSFNGARTGVDFAVAYQEATLTETPFEMAVDINIDFTHLRHVHHNTPPGRAPQMEGALREHITELEGLPANDGSFTAEFLGNHGRSGGKITFVAPCTVMTETFFIKPEFKPFPLVLVFRFVPVGPTKTKVLLKIYRDFLHSAPDFLVKDLVMNMPKVIEQDRLIMAGQLLRMRQGSPHTWTATESDGHLLAFRDWYQGTEPETGAWFAGWEGRKAVRRKACGLVAETSEGTALTGDMDIADTVALGGDIWSGGESAGLASLAAAGPQRITAMMQEMRAKASKAGVAAAGIETEPPQEM